MPTGIRRDEGAAPGLTWLEFGPDIAMLLLKESPSATKFDSQDDTRIIIRIRPKIDSTPETNAAKMKKTGIMDDKAGKRENGYAASGDEPAVGISGTR